MKKLFTTPEYKRRQERKNRKEERRKKNRHTYSEHTKKTYVNNTLINSVIKNIIPVPTDFRLLKNTEKCLNFFSKLRLEENISIQNKHKFVEITFSEVTNIDYSSISILTAILDDLKINRVALRTDFPKDPMCKDFILESGFFNYMYTSKGKPFKQSIKSDTLFFEKGQKRFTTNDNIRISKASKKVNEYLTGDNEYCQSMRTILLEICGNSIEWAGTENNQWLLMVKYEENRVIITVTDVGKGIIKTLYRKFGRQFEDKGTFRSKDQVLKRAFEKKYSSSSQKSNRNKGLPSIKKMFDNKEILELKVLTNNVILHFDSEENSRTMKAGTSWFKGTFYRWVVTKECILNNKTHEKK